MRTPLPTLAAAFALAASPTFGQTIVRSWDVAPLGAAFVGGVEYDCANDVCWIVDSTNDLISAYTGTGVFIQSFPAPTATVVGVAVDPANGMLWIGDESETVYQFDPVAGAATGVSWSCSPTITDLSGLSLDPATGNIVVVNDSARVIGVFTQAGATVSSISVGAAGTTDPDGIVYDHDTGHYFLGDDSLNSVFEVDAAGALVASWNLGAMNISPEGLGIDKVNGHLYIGDGFVTRKVYVMSGIVAAGGTCPGGGPSLAKTGACPGVMTLAVAGGTPGGRAAVVHGQAGSFTKPSGTCAGVTLGISQPTLAVVLQLDAAGAASLTFNAPGGVCGRTVQAVDVTSCTPTNTITL